MNGRESLLIGIFCAREAIQIFRNNSDLVVAARDEMQKDLWLRNHWVATHSIDPQLQLLQSIPNKLRFKPTFKTRHKNVCYTTERHQLRKCYFTIKFFFSNQDCSFSP